MITLLFTHNSWEIMWAIVVFQNPLGHEKRICHRGQFLFWALVIAVWSICLIWDWPIKSSKLSGLVARIVCFWVVVSIFLISMLYYIWKIFNKSYNLKYYFFNELQEKDFFDKKEKINKKLNNDKSCVSVSFWGEWNNRRIHLHHVCLDSSLRSGWQLIPKPPQCGTNYVQNGKYRKKPTSYRDQLLILIFINT